MGNFQFYFFFFSGMYIILAWAIYIMFRVDQPYFGAIYSMTIGGYIAAYTSSVLGWPIWLIMIAAMAVCGMVAFLLSLKLADLSAFPMIIASLALVLIVQTVTRNLGFLGGQYGLFGVEVLPKSVILGIIYAILAVVGWFVYRLDHSYIGRSMDAVHYDRAVASGLGINVRGTIMRLQVVSSMIGALCGVLYVFVMGGAFPQAFGTTLFLYTLSIVIVGGMYTMWGVIVAAPFLWVIGQILPGSMASLTNIVYSVLLIIVLLTRPAGIIDRKVAAAVVRGFEALGRGWNARRVRANEVDG
jgi:branched-chain amino acid transport system permease protein